MESPTSGRSCSKTDCDSYFEPVGWRGVEADLEWAPTATAVFDDGSGPALYVAGKFNYSDSGPVGRIARWTPTGWQDVGGGVTFSTQPEILSLAVYDDGTGAALYAGGKFTSAGRAHRPTIWRSGTESAGARWVAVSTDWSAASR